MIDDPLDNATRIRDIHTKLLLLHGDADDFVPWLTNGRVVYENAPQPKTLELIHGAKHDDIPKIMGVSVFQDSILNFLRR